MALFRMSCNVLALQLFGWFIPTLYPLGKEKKERANPWLLRKAGICVSSDRRFLLVRVKPDLTNTNKYEPELLFLVELALLSLGLCPL